MIFHNSAGPTMEIEEFFTATIKDNEYVVMSGAMRRFAGARVCQAHHTPALINALPPIG